MSEGRTRLAKALLHFHPAAWIWIALVGVLWLAVATTGAEPASEAARRLAEAADGPWLPAVLLAAYTLRTVLLLPSTALALVAGWAAGPLLGAALAWFGALLSASLTYALGRWARRDRVAARVATSGAIGQGAASGWRDRLTDHAFEAVLLTRLAAVPGDAVNLVSGATKVPYLPFATATALGGLPGVLAAVWAGASIEGAFVMRSVTVQPGLIVASASMAALGLASAWWLRRRARS